MHSPSAPPCYEDLNKIPIDAKINQSIDMPIQTQPQRQPLNQTQDFNQFPIPCTSSPIAVISNLNILKMLIIQTIHRNRSKINYCGHYIYCRYHFRLWICKTLYRLPIAIKNTRRLSCNMQNSFDILSVLHLMVKNFSDCSN